MHSSLTFSAERSSALRDIFVFSFWYTLNHFLSHSNFLCRTQWRRENVFKISGKHCRGRAQGCNPVNQYRPFNQTVLQKLKSLDRWLVSLRILLDTILSCLPVMYFWCFFFSCTGLQWLRILRSYVALGIKQMRMIVFYNDVSNLTVQVFQKCNVHCQEGLTLLHITSFILIDLNQMWSTVETRCEYNIVRRVRVIIRRKCGQ